MFANWNFGIALVVGVVVVNNIAYLVDLIRGDFGLGMIFLGAYGIIGVVVGIALIVAGLVVMGRARPDGSSGAV